ncbi:MAG: hypothetical protein EAZ91_12825 [Cytophagales bacterium]|nr:MAG: hypothetical protein EAZ91_12825 [Cytophagales bacterium]
MYASFSGWRRLVVLFGWAVLAVTATFAQTTPTSTPILNPPTTCGPDDYTVRRMASDSAYRSFVQNAYPVQTDEKAGSEPLLTIPVIFVVYHLGESVGQGSNVPESVLRAQVDLMNLQFAGGPNISSENGSTDTRIRFVMARRTADCTPFNGVFRIDGRAVPGYSITGVDYGDNTMQSNMRTLAGSTINQMGQQAVIVRVYWKVTGAGGWAGFGGDISVSSGSMSYNVLYANLMAHEMGHVLFLSHTFEGGDDNINCPPNTNPATQGDQVADTDPHLKNQPGNVCSVASENTINTCTGLPFGRIGRNFMSYGCDTYMFTPGQIARMRSYLAGSLSRFVTSPYALPPAVGEGVLAAACVPTSNLPTNVSTYHTEGIARVQFSSLDSRTNHIGSLALLMGDYSCSRQTTVQAGLSYTLTIDAPNNNQHRRVYIDWNNDGAFNETTELVFSTALGAETGVILVPATANQTQTLRMRVVVCDGPVPPTACEVPAYGAAQDFGIRVIPPTPTAGLRVGQLNSLSLCSGSLVQIPYTLTTGSSGSSVFVTAELSDALGSFANPVVLGSGSGGLLTVELPTTLATGSGYRIRLVDSGSLYASDQTPALTIRRTPTGTMAGPASVRDGQLASLTITLTGEGPWLVMLRPMSASVALNDNALPGQYSTNLLTLTNPTTIIEGQPRQLTSYRIVSINNGCLATSTGSAITVNVTCDPPTGLTEVTPNTTQATLMWENAGGYRQFFARWKESTAPNWTVVSPTSSTISYLSSLTLGRTYNWEVAQTCTNSSTTAYSPTRSFTLGCPTPLSPYEQITPTTAQLYWTYAGVPAYTVRWRPVGTSSWSTVSGVTSAYLVPGMVPGQAYEWQVAATCTSISATSAFTPVRSFTVACMPPVNVMTTSISSTTARATWCGVTGQQYTISWRPASTTSVWTILSPVTGGTALLGNLPEGQSIEWRIGAVCSASATSALTNGSPFNTLCPAPNAPLISGVAATSALLSWPSQYVNGYAVQWRKVGAASWSSSPTTGSTVSSMVVSSLEHNMAYEARYALVCRTNSQGSYSNPVSFTTLDCAPPALVSFSGSQSALSGQVVTLTASLTGASPWSVLLNTGHSFTGVTASPASLTVSYTNPNSYTLGRQVWVVQVANACQTVSPSVTVLTVKVLPACGVPPTNLRLMNQQTTQVGLTWDAGLLANSHTLQWRAVGVGTWTTVPSLYQTHILNNLTFGQAYEWQVTPVCMFGQPVTPSPVQTFTMNCPTAYGQTETYSPTEARLSWASVGTTSVTVSYTLRWRLAGATTWTTVPNLQTNTYSLTGLTANGAYEWAVQPTCAGGSMGGASGIRSFTTGCSIPPTPYTYNNTSSSAVVNWQTGFAGVQYALRWRLTLPTAWTTGTATFTGTVGSLTGLSAGSMYQVQVQAVCAGGQRSPFSESGNLTTLACPNMYTVKAGSWLDPSVWSCNRVPVSTDAVEIRHVVLLEQGMGYTRRMSFTLGGKLVYGLSGLLRMGF